MGSLTDRTDDESLRQQLKQTQGQLATASQELDATNQKLSASEQQLAEVAGSRDELKQQVETLTASRQQLQAELDRTQEELAKLKENPPPANTQQPAVELKLPSPADLLNQLKKANGKKFTASLTDVEKILESLGGEES